MNIFQRILDCRSLTNISYFAEDALPTAQSDAERAALQAIISSNKLDEIYAIAHEQLGQHEEAAKLRAWLASRQPRASLSSLEMAD